MRIHELGFHQYRQHVDARVRVRECGRAPEKVMTQMTEYKTKWNHG